MRTKEELRKLLIAQGANEDTVDEFEAATRREAYDEGYDAGCDQGYGICP